MTEIIGAAAVVVSVVSEEVIGEEVTLRLGSGGVSTTELETYIDELGSELALATALGTAVGLVPTTWKLLLSVLAAKWSLVLVTASGISEGLVSTTRRLLLTYLITTGTPVLLFSVTLRLTATVVLSIV